MKAKRILLVVLLAGFVGLLVLAKFLLSWQKYGINSLDVEVVKIGDSDALALSSFEHPPWAMVHAVNYDIDYPSNVIRVTRYYAPFAMGIRGFFYNRWPLIIRNGIGSDEKYRLEFWNGKTYEEAGVLTVSKEHGYTWTETSSK